MDTVSLRDREVPLELLMPLIKERLAAGQSVRFSPKGTSMLPMLRQGIDSVVLSPLPEKLKKYDLPLYRRADGSFVLHRVIKVADAYTCIGDNQFQTEPGLTHDQMIGVVTAFYRGAKRRKVSAVPHQIYCRAWHYTRFPRRVCRWLKAQVRRLLK